MNPIRAIRIDAEHRVVEEVRLTSLKDAQTAVGGYLERVWRLGTVNELYGDEEARLKGLRYAFHFDGCDHEIIVGNAILVGGDDDTGDWADATLSVPDVIARVSWLSAVHVDRGIGIVFFGGI